MKTEVAAIVCLWFVIGLQWLTYRVRMRDYETLDRLKTVRIAQLEQNIQLRRQLDALPFGNGTRRPEGMRS